MDTIAALATPPGRSGVAVIRVSGPRVRFVIETIAGKLPAARSVSLRQLRDRAGNVLDEGLVLFFPGPHSFTGEDCAEFHVHGSVAVIRSLLRVMTGPECAVRLGQAGEFTRRAFENGKLDLARVEGLGALIDSETEHQRVQAVDAMRGALSDKIDFWRVGLISALAQVEALIDFGDEGDVIEHAGMFDRGTVASIGLSIAGAISGSERGMRVRDGISIAIVGAPNAGKSSLLNALARCDVAIVSPIPGTTRDIVEVSLDIAGYLVRISDTAGLRESVDPIEIEGMRRARARMQSADIVLVLQAGDEPPQSAGSSILNIVEPCSAEKLFVASKSDLDGSGVGLRVSAKTGDGLEALLEQLAQLIETRWGRESVVVTHERQKAILQTAQSALQRAQSATLAIELVAEELRSAIRALDAVLGRIDVEDVLDQVFSRFCIGK